MNPQRFLGIDFGWEGKASGLAALEWAGDSLHLTDLQLCAGLDDILAWADQHGGPDTVIGVDAPLVIPNASGMREADKLAHSRYGRYHAGCYPASRARSYWRRTTGLSEALLARGYQHGDNMPVRAPGRFQIEVHPHAAVVQLQGLDRIIKYKRGSLAVRRAGLEQLRAILLRRFSLLTPRLVLRELPEIPLDGPALKALEDRLDAIICAYVAAYWWYWGSSRNEVLGSAAAGYLVVPQRQQVAPIADLRENYTRAGLLEADADPDPFTQFERWFSDARSSGLREPNAMTLATSTPDGAPSARVVLLKGFDAAGFVFYTNYESEKGRQLAANPNAALVFAWLELERQVRIVGSVSKVSREESEAYFHSRPVGSQLGAWASRRQSAPVKGREPLERRLAELQSEYAGKPIPLPPFWGGYRLQPRSIEFWQGRPNRLHDRLVYTAEPGGGWTRNRLSP